MVFANNVSEGWHNKFQLVVGHHHPAMYSATEELQNEQAETKSSVAELSLSRGVEALPQNKWVLAQTRIQSVAANYVDYKQRGNVLEYLRRYIIVQHYFINRVWLMKMVTNFGNIFWNKVRVKLIAFGIMSFGREWYLGKCPVISSHFRYQHSKITFLSY